MTPSFSSVLIVDQGIDSRGTIANIALVVGLSAGRELPGETFGSDITDGEGAVHRYLTRIGHIVRKAGQSKMRSIRAVLAGDPRILLVDYTEDAAPSNYAAYASSLSTRAGAEIQYRALYMYGPSEVIGPLTKNLSGLE